MVPLVACNDAHLLPDGGIVGDPTEAALLVLAAKTGLDADAVRRRLPHTGEVPFDPAAKFMATFHPEPDGRTRVYVKGALDVLLPHCTSIATGGGAQILDERHREQVRAAAHDMASAGLRVLAAATVIVDQPARPEPSAGEPVLAALTLVCVVGIADPPRPQVRDAIALCHRAGVTVKMITGDHADTAAAIARELGIDGEAVTDAQRPGTRPPYRKSCSAAWPWPPCTMPTGGPRRTWHRQEMSWPASATARSSRLSV